MSDDSPPKPVTGRSPGRMLLLGLALAAATLLLIAALGAAWMRSEAALQTALARVPGLQVQGLSGSLLGERIRAQRLTWQGTADGPSCVVEQLELDAPSWTWRPQPGVWVGLTLTHARAARVSCRTGSPTGQPPPVPKTLRLPFELVVSKAQVERLQVDDLTPIGPIQAALHLGAAQGAAHQIDTLVTTTEQAQLTGRARIAADPPFALDAALQAQSLPGRAPPWQAQAEAQGALDRFELRATLRGRSAQGGEAKVDANARIAPMSAWPLEALNLSTERLDLAELVAGAPRTQLGGRAEVNLVGLDQPASVKLALRNAQPLAWSAGGLPVAELAVDASTQPRDWREVRLARFDVRLAEGTRPAGRWQGSGLWNEAGLQLRTELAQVQPALLHQQAPALVASGPVQLTVTGLPTLAQATGRDGPTNRGAPLDPAARVEARLTGHGLAAGVPPRPVQLSLALKATRDRLDVDQATLQDGPSAARAALTLERQGRGWGLRGQGDVERFDPGPWWRPAAEVNATAGTTRLSGPWRADLKLPPRASGQEVWAWAQGVRGEFALSLRDSLLAGVTMEGKAEARHDGQAWQVQAEARSGPNQAQIAGSVSAQPAQDRWTLAAALPRLADFVPWSRLAPQAREAWPQSGDLQLDIRWSGRWPQLSTDGQARARAIRMASGQLERAELSWRAGGTDTAPWDIRLAAQGLKQGDQRLDALQARLEGTRAAHRLDLQVDSPARPPAWTENMLGSTRGGTRLQLKGLGRWEAVSSGGARWQAQGAQLLLAAREGRDPWLQVQDLTGEARLDERLALQTLTLAPGRAQLPGGAALRWDLASWTAREGGDLLTLKAELETLAVAPWLARVQPGIGWGGDLRVGATLDVKADRRFEADIVFQRHGGDLRITDELGQTQALGLTDLRLGLVARDGLWQFTQAVAGAHLGEMAGAQVLRTGADQRWPKADTPMEGVLEMRVAQLAAWGAWVPPGWRLGGNLRVSAGLGGRFGAPELRGEMVGRELAVRNLLQGVNVSDGELLATLSGEQVKVERFAFRGGDGTLVLTGGGTLGATPSARLNLVADRFRWLGRIDRRLVASGRADMQLSRESLRLDGRVDIDEGLFDFSRGDAPGLDGDVNVSRTPAAGANGAAAAPGPSTGRPAATLPTALRNAQVDLRIALGSKLTLKGRGLDTRLQGDLRLSSPAGRLAVHGTVRAENGTYVAYGQTMEIERGEVGFAGPIDNPRLDIRAVRPNLDVVVGVSVTGSTQNPRVKLFSTPEMSDYDKLSWLVLGRAPDGLGRADTALLQRAAVALLAGEGEAPTDSLIRNLGLTDFSLRQTDGDVRETVVTLGKQLSRRWYVGYERSVNATSGTWQLIYRIAQRFTLRAQSGEDNSLDLIWSWRW